MSETEIIYLEAVSQVTILTKVVSVDTETDMVEFVDFPRSVLMTAGTETPDPVVGQEVVAVIGIDADGDWVLESFRVMTK